MNCLGAMDNIRSENLQNENTPNWKQIEGVIFNNKFDSVTNVTFKALYFYFLLNFQNLTVKIR